MCSGKINHLTLKVFQVYAYTQLFGILFFLMVISNSLRHSILLGVVTERIKEAHENSDAPLMLIFPGYFCFSFPLTAIRILVIFD